jgi:hypothetical protein
MKLALIMLALAVASALRGCSNDREQFCSDPNVQVLDCMWRHYANLSADCQGLIGPFMKHAIDQDATDELRKMMESQMPTTDEVAVHGQAALYGPLTAEYRGTNVKMLEIGLGCDTNYGPGASVTLWRKWFGPDAKIWSAVYSAKCVASYEGLRELNLSALAEDIAGTPTLQRWIGAISKPGPFDIIIDKSDIITKQKLNTFVMLWQVVKPGGMLIVEDLQVDQARGYGDWGHPMVEILQAWTDQLLIQSKYYRYGGDTPKASTYPLPPGAKYIYCSDEICAVGKCSADDKRKHCMEPQMDYATWKSVMLTQSGQKA